MPAAASPASVAVSFFMILYLQRAAVGVAALIQMRF
jgi:hypothetical protein